MTIAERTANRKKLLQELQDRVRRILSEQQEPISLGRIEFELKAEQLRTDPSQFDSTGIDTFDVRDVIAALVEAGTAEYTVGRDVRLRK